MEWAPLIGAALLFAGTVLTIRAGQSKGLTEREENERTRQSKRLDDAEDRIESLERHSRVQDDYIRALRNHIDAKLPPPPPPWPTELGGA